MRLSFGLEQRLVQKQMLAPRMIQSMEILQLPIQALEARIEQEMNENPLFGIARRRPDRPRNRSKLRIPTNRRNRNASCVVDEGQ